MRYSLDIRDRMNAYGLGTVMECTPTYRIFLDEAVSVSKLQAALESAFHALPYFKTRLVFDGKYGLEANDAELPIYHCRLEDRPLSFGTSAGGYPFQVSYYENELIFDMAHFPCDTLGFLYFIKAVVAAYFGMELRFDSDIYLKLPFEGNYDEAACRPVVRTQAEGFRADRIKSYPPAGASSHCTLLSASLEQILTYRRRVDASPAAIISALLAKVFRTHLAERSDIDESNNVRGKIVVSTRNALGGATVHNCYQQSFITYTDAFDKFDFSMVCSLYRAILDLQVQEECAWFDVKKQTETLRMMEADPDFAHVRDVVKRDAIDARKNLCNFNFSYFGPISFEGAAAAHVVDFQAICFNENCDFGVFAYSFGDRIYLMISENYADRNIIAELLKEGREQGLVFEKISSFIYHQAHYEIACTDEPTIKE